MPICIVSFVDLDGIRHSVEVHADGLFEAAVLALAAFKKHDFTPGGLTQLEVEVRSSITHTVTVKKVEEWLQRGVSFLASATRDFFDCCSCSISAGVSMFERNEGKGLDLCLIGSGASPRFFPSSLVPSSNIR